MSKQAKLTPVEWEIMESAWAIGKRVTARDVHNHAFPNGEKAYTTVQTILNKLHQKGFLKCEKLGMVNYFSAKKSRTMMLKEEILSVSRQLFHGSVPDMANFLIDTGDIGLKEIREIKQFLELKEKELEDESS